MTRNDFLKKAVQAGLFAALTVVLFTLKNRITTTGNCSSCPDIKSCPGKKECRKY